MNLRLIVISCALLGCSNQPGQQGSPSPPPPVAAPVIACSPPPPDAGCDDSGACDGGPTYYYDKCQLPPSVCADSHWAAYFDDGSCVNGTCALVTKYHYCDTGCSDGRCIFNGPTAAGRGF